MRAATTRVFGFRPELTTIEARQPEICAKDVLVEVYATSVNPKDWKLNQTFSGLIPEVGFLKKPLLIGDDLAGVIVAKGKSVEGFDIGDAVYGMDMHLRTAACAEYARIDAGRIAIKPDNLSFEEAAAVPLAGQTALQGLRIGKVQEGSKVLIIGASGGVGTFAIQIAKAMGAHVTGVCSGKNTAFVRELGADATIDYTQEDLTQRRDNFDVVFDVTSHQSLAACSGLMHESGIFVSTGGNAHAILTSIRDRFRTRQAKQKSKNVWVDSNTKDLTLLADYLEKGLIKPVIDSTFTMDEIDAAYQRNRSGHCAGKVVVVVRDDKGRPD